MKQISSLFIIMFFAAKGFAQQADSLTVLKQVDSLRTVVNNLLMSEENEEALSILQQVSNISKQAWGENNIIYANSLSHLARVYEVIGQTDKAENFYNKAIDLVGKLQSKLNFDYIRPLFNLATLYAFLGNYSKAEPMYLETVELLSKTLGTDDPKYAMALSNLADLYRDTGNYDKAESDYQKSIKIIAKSEGTESLLYASILNNFAIMCHAKGDDNRAVPLFLESLNIRAITLGKDHPAYAKSLDNLASIYSAQGKFDKALAMFLEAKEIWTKITDKNSLEYANSLSALGVFYHTKGEFDKAESLLWEAEEIYGKVLGKEHPSYATDLMDLAILYMNKCNYDKAEALILESKGIMETALGREHPSYAELLGFLASLYQQTNRPSKSAAVLLELNECNHSLIEKASLYSSESQMRTYLRKFKKDIAQIQSYSQVNTSPELERENFDNTLFFKGFLLGNTRQLTRDVDETDSLTRIIYTRWQDCRRLLAAEYARPISERRDITQVEQEAEDYEQKLARKISSFNKLRERLHWQQVRDQLRPDEAAVEFIHYRYFTPKATDSTMYAALVLRAGWESPKWITLFEEKQLDSLLQRNGERNELYVKQLYSLTNRGVVVVGKSPKTLYELVWLPLEKVLGVVHTVYFSPSGQMHLLNFSAIPIATDSTLSDKYKLLELGSTRELVMPNERRGDNNDALLFGGIQYDMDSSAISQANATVKKLKAVASRGELSFSFIDSTSRGGRWNYLPFTEKEVDSVERILKTGGVMTQARKAYTATEEAFKSIGRDTPSPRILHVATHGFFFPDPKDTLQHQPFGDREPVFKLSDNPMIRSGLILAGANHAWQNEKPLKDGMEDGILTAYEISQMNLSNTELVVLSACETGLGDIQGNEGVYGLQRAFKIAGAKYLIMSLWQVPDKQTSLLMTIFYKKWLEGKMKIPEAFQAAQKELRDAGLDPYQWAGFVLVE